MKIDVYVSGKPRGTMEFSKRDVYTTFIFGEYQIMSDSKKKKFIINHLKDTNCPFCHHQRIHIKDKLWLCPGMEGSPMHGFGPVPMSTSLKEFLKEKNCTLEEYQIAVFNYYKNINK